MIGGSVGAVRWRAKLRLVPSAHWPGEDPPLLDAASSWAASPADRSWLATLAAGELGVWFCEQDDSVRVVAREALSGTRTAIAKAKAVDLPPVGFAAGRLRLEVVELNSEGEIGGCGGR